MTAALTAEQRRRLESYDPTLSGIPGTGVGLADFIDNLVTDVTAVETALGLVEDEQEADDSGECHMAGATIAASTAITGATETAAQFSTKVAIAAGEVSGFGARIHIRAIGTHTATTGAETHTMALLIGTTVLYVSGNIDPADGDLFVFDVDVIYAAADRLVVMGWFSSGVPGTGTAKVIGSVITSSLPDFTVANDVAVQIDRQGTATDSDSARLDGLVVDVFDVAA